VIPAIFVPALRWQLCLHAQVVMTALHTCVRVKEAPRPTSAAQLPFRPPGSHSSCLPSRMNSVCQSEGSKQTPHEISAPEYDWNAVILTVLQTCRHASHQGSEANKCSITTASAPSRPRIGRASTRQFSGAGKREDDGVREPEEALV
jgi:hypothetical protein